MKNMGKENSRRTWMLAALLIQAGGQIVSGQIVGWGSNSPGPSNVPVGLSNNVAAISAGGFHDLAVLTNGTVVAWGYNNVGQTSVPVGLSNVVSVACGGFHNLALKSDGTVVAWGAGTTNNGVAFDPLYRYGQSMVPAGLSNVVAIAAGDYQSMALRSDGSVVAWGAFYTDGLNHFITPVTMPSGLSNVVAIAAGTSHGMALRGDGTVINWGVYDIAVNNFRPMVVPPGLSNVTSITAGGWHCLALREDSTVAGWGSGTNNAASARQYGQAKIPNGLTNVVSLDGGGYHSLAVRANGTVAAWGYNNYGQTNVPPGLSNVVAVQGGWHYCMALIGRRAPVFSERPVNRTVPVGMNAIFRIGVNGALPLSYQWSCNGTNIPGGTNMVLMLTNVQPASAGNDYTLTASNALGTATSGSMFLYEVPLEVYVTTTNVPVLAGSTTTLAAHVNGQEPMAYQWLFNGTNLPGMTDPTLSLENVQLHQAGDYSVMVSNSIGTVTSAAASLAVWPFLMTAAPASQTAIMGSSPSFSIAVSSAVPMSYQWQFNGTDLTGATNSSLVLPGVQVNQAGVYSVNFGNLYGSGTTNATLTVQPFAFAAGGTNLLMTANGFQFRVDGIFATQSVVILATTNLVDWMPILTNPPTTGSVQFLDFAATNWPLRFYRASEQ